MVFYKKYDLDLIKKDLQKRLRIMDWDISIEILNAIEMGDETDDYSAYGFCERYRCLREAVIKMNKDNVDEKNFLITLIHEMCHILTDDVDRKLTEMLDYISDDITKDKENNSYKVDYEKMVEMIAKGICNCLPNDYLKQFLITEGVNTDAKTKKSK